MYDLISYLLQPFVLILLFLGYSITRYLRKRPEQRQNRLWPTILFLLLLVLSLPATNYLVIGALEWQYAPQNDRPEDIQAIVVLDGGGLPQDRWRERAELAPASLFRTLQAARLYHQTGPCLILVTGGNTEPDNPGPPFVDLMAELLVQQGVRPSDVLVEHNSRTTYENAVESRKLLDQRGVNRIMLVTDAIHLPRAVPCFRKQGFEVVPSGCHYRATEFKISLYQFLPRAGAIGVNEEATHEWIGLAWYWLSGRM